MIPENTDVILTIHRGSSGRSQEVGGRRQEEEEEKEGGRLALASSDLPPDLISIQHLRGCLEKVERGPSIPLRSLSGLLRRPTSAPKPCVFSYLVFHQKGVFASGPNGTSCDCSRTREAVINAVCGCTEKKIKTPRLTK